MSYFASSLGSFLIIAKIHVYMFVLDLHEL
jgi:hypothetical protein